MGHVLMFRETDADFAQRNDPAAAPAYWGAWNACISALMGAGVVVSGNGLQPPHTSTTVRMRDGNRQVQDGPFAETHEHLVALLVYRWHGLAAAEDSLGAAVATALQHWPVIGVPASPEAWLVAAAQPTA